MDIILEEAESGNEELLDSLRDFKTSFLAEVTGGIGLEVLEDGF